MKVKLKIIEMNIKKLLIMILVVALGALVFSLEKCSNPKNGAAKEMAGWQEIHVPATVKKKQGVSKLNTNPNMKDEW